MNGAAMAVPERAQRPDTDVARRTLHPHPAVPGRVAFHILRGAFTALPLIAGVDKFFDVLTPWPSYLSPEVSDLLGVAPWSIMHAAGVVEILAGIMVAFRPRIGGWLVAVWLWIVTANLFLLPGHYDIALRDLTLSLAALALAKLAADFHHASKS
jgi:hypothetical protein